MRIRPAGVGGSVTVRPSLALAGGGAAVSADLRLAGTDSGLSTRGAGGPGRDRSLAQLLKFKLRVRVSDPSGKARTWRKVRVR